MAIWNAKPQDIGAPPTCGAEVPPLLTAYPKSTPAKRSTPSPPSAPPPPTAPAPKKAHRSLTSPPPPPPKVPPPPDRLPPIIEVEDEEEEMPDYRSDSDDEAREEKKGKAIVLTERVAPGPRDASPAEALNVTLCPECGDEMAIGMLACTSCGHSRGGNRPQRS